MSIFNNDVIYEIAKYLDERDYLTIRFVFRVPYEHIYDDTLNGAIWLIKKGFRIHEVVLKYMLYSEVAIYDSWYAYRYAIYANKGAWPQGEDTIKTAADCSYYYAKNVIKGPWPSGEKIIATDANYSYLYAKNIIKNRWPPGEAAIRSNKYDSKSYDNFIDTCFQN